jgi:hypothetical protein
VSRPEWERKGPAETLYDAVRAADIPDFSDLEDYVKDEIQFIFDAMDWPQLIVFKYGDSDRLVAPYVVGVSSEGNPLLRGYQLEGISRSGKGPGWRVFQIRKMNYLDNAGDYFSKEDFPFDEFYPWVYKVIKML